jgi:hypothetical protein
MIDNTDPIQKYLLSISLTPTDNTNYRIVQTLLKVEELTVDQLEEKHTMFITVQRTKYGNTGTLTQPKTDWREIWNSRRKQYRTDTYARADKWAAKNQPNFDKTLKIDFHPKDWYVIYTEPDPTIAEVNVKRVSLNKECVENDWDIHNLFMLGYTFPEIVDQLYLKCSVQAVQRYVSDKRKFESERWPYRRTPPQIVVGDEQGFYRLLKYDGEQYSEVVDKTRAKNKDEARMIFRGKGLL